MNMEHGAYVELLTQLKTDLDSHYMRIDRCESNVSKEADKIEDLKAEFSKLREEVRVDRAKTNTRLNILISILSAIAVPIIGVCVRLIFLV